MITIDAGNSRIKWASFRQGKLCAQGAFAYSEGYAESADAAGLSVAGERVLLSSVAGDKKTESLVNWLDASGCDSVYSAKTQPQQKGVVNAYADAKSLGVDRWMAIIAACHHPGREGRRCCVIDLGTAATFDVLEPDGRHVGGYIMPGYQLMLDSLGGQTEQLPRLKSARLDTELGPADNTLDAITRGAAQLLVTGLGGLIERFAVEDAKDEGLLVLLTGGDVHMIAPLLSSCMEGRGNIEIVTEPVLVLKGLALSGQGSDDLQLFDRLK